MRLYHEHLRIIFATSNLKPKQNETHQKIEQKSKEISRNTENALPQSSQKILYLNKISPAEISEEDVQSSQDSTIKMFKVLIQYNNHDSGIYLIVPPVQQIDSIKPIWIRGSFLLPYHDLILTKIFNLYHSFVDHS